MEHLANITDKQQRVIGIYSDDSRVVAFHNNEEVGVLEFDFQDNGVDCVDILTFMQVENLYQSAGIAAAMVNEAENIYGDFCIVNHFADEGAKFWNSYRSNNGYYHLAVEDNRY